MGLTTPADLIRESVTGESTPTPGATFPSPTDTSSGGYPPDVDGVTFDPTIHAVDPGTGQPIRTRRGAYRRRRRPSTDPEIRDAAADLAETAVSVLVGVATTVGGPLWAASDEERRALIRATTRYLVALGVELPPWAELTVAVGMYATPRCLIALATPRQKTPQNPPARSDGRGDNPPGVDVTGARF